MHNRLALPVLLLALTGVTPASAQMASDPVPPSPPQRLDLDLVLPPNPDPHLARNAVPPSPPLRQDVDLVLPPSPIPHLVRDALPPAPPLRQDVDVVLPKVSETH